ncbi:hypothetical protein M3Y99_00759900 [Aphelenchoides fujianensis]|nr:hypothetical protein M3Y99_00759900 [Aphelenchoides fujianensis]
MRLASHPLALRPATTARRRGRSTCNGDDKAGFDLLEKLPLVKRPAILNDDEPRTTGPRIGPLDPEDKLRVCA